LGAIALIFRSGLGVLIEKTAGRAGHIEDFAIEDRKKWPEDGMCDVPNICGRLLSNCSSSLSVRVQVFDLSEHDRPVSIFRYKRQDNLKN